MKVLAETTECIGGSCPTIYETEAGEIVVQGPIMRIEGDEAFVVVSRELFERAVKQGA